MMVAVTRSFSSFACASAWPEFRPALFRALMPHCQPRAVLASVVPPQSFNMLVMSSVSRMLKFFFSPSAAPSSRSRRTPSAWKVQISTLRASRPTSCLARSRISAAALLVKVMAAMRSAASPALMSRPILCVITRVLPEPAPASTRQGPPRWFTASSWARFRPWDMGTSSQAFGKASDDTGGPVWARVCCCHRLTGLGRVILRQSPTVLNILLVTFPFFALVLAGFLAAHRRMLPLEAIPGLNGFVLFFALPCMLYRFGSTTPIAQLLDASVAGVYLLCALVMVGFAIAMTMNSRIRWNDASMGALVAAFPNTGFMGVPLLAALLGPQSAGPVIVLIVVDMVITSSLCIALSRLDEGEGHGGQAMLVAGRKALSGVVVNPMPWAILLGGVASAVQFTLPGPVEKTVWLLADAASQVALFTIGAVLARSQIQSSHPMPTSDYLPVAIMKLLLHPLLVLAVGTAAIQLGVPLTPFALTVMVLVSALPSASNVSLLAERFGADNGRIARIILVTTAAAFLTFSGAVALMT